MLQWLAASHARRKLVYYTFGEKKFADELREIVTLVQNKRPTVGAPFRFPYLVERVFWHGGWRY